MAAVKSQDDGKCSRTEREGGDQLKDYRQVLRSLEQATEAVASLRERAAGLEARLDELTLEAAALLDSDEVERESALTVTRNVIEGKLSRVRERLSQAEATVSSQTQTVKGELARLFLIFKLHRIELEKAALVGRMISGAPVLSVEQVVINLRSIVELSRLDVTAQSVEALVPQAERLLEAVQGLRGTAGRCHPRMLL
jgi:uncharacterized protein YicC (UPF0701 family)